MFSVKRNKSERDFEMIADQALDVSIEKPVDQEPNDVDDLLIWKAAPPMSDDCFWRFSRYIHGTFGIKVPPVKKTMLESRLQKRLRKLKLTCFGEYTDFVFSEEGMKGEVIHMIDEVTTNKTDFFREPAQFDFLMEEALPEMQARRIGIRRPLQIWSAGCSTGEEPYTIAMVLSEFTESHESFHYAIQATDISTKVLEMALRGVYKEEKTQPVPEAMKKKHIMLSKDRESGLARVAPGIRSQVRFRRLNLMDDDFGLEKKMDMIFCRNVIIYFDKPTQYALIKQMCDCLAPGGYLFLGHSETLHSMDLPLEQVAPMTHRKVT